MGMLDLPNEINQRIVSFLNPSATSIIKMQQNGKNIVNLSRACRRLESICKNELIILKNKIFRIFESKYTAYDETADFYRGLKIDPGKPQLLDALSTGSCSAKSTFKKYTPEIEKDIKLMVSLMPESMHCPLGEELLQIDMMFLL